MPPEETASLLAVPVTTLDDAELAEWSQMHMARGRESSVFLLNLRRQADDDDDPSVPREPLEIVRRIANLRSVSEQAFQLAVYLSTAPFTIPVARLIQKAKFGPDANVSLLAEVFLSGLVVASRERRGREDSNTIYYAMVSQARNVLLRSLRNAEAREIAEELLKDVSRHVEAIAGQPFTMRALVPNSRGVYDVPSWVQPFARVAASLLGLGRGEANTEHQHSQATRQLNLTDEAVLAAHTAAVTGAYFSPDGTQIITSSNDTTVGLWDGASGALRALLRGHVADVTSAIFSTDGGEILTASKDSTARLWDSATRAVRAVLLGHTGAVMGAIFSPDGARVLTAGEDGTARLWDATAGTGLAVLEGHTAAVVSAVFSSDGARILTASRDSTAWLWTTSAGAAYAILRGHTSAINGAVFSPDGARVLTSSMDCTVRLWDAATGDTQLILHGHTGAVTGAVFSPDGNRIVTASRDGTARLWDSATGALVVTCRGHTGAVISAVYSPDGTRFVTAAGDGVARVWEAETGMALATCTGHAGAVASAVFSPDCTRIATASWDGTARLYNASLPPRPFPEVTPETSVSMREAIARHPAAPPGVLSELAADTAVKVREAVAGNRITPPRVLAHLARDEAASVREIVAGNPATPTAALAHLAHDIADAVREAIAISPRAPLAELKELARDNADTVRAAVAANPVTQLADLEQLARDHFDSVREAVAANPATAPRILSELARDEAPNVRSEVAWNGAVAVEILEELAGDPTIEVREAVASSPETPETLLLQLANDEALEVREAAAANSATPIEALVRLAHDPVATVREAVAANPSTPEAVLLALERDPAAEVREAMEAAPRRGSILIAGLGGAGHVSEQVWRPATAIGAALARAGYDLVCGGWPGVDHIVAREFETALTQTTAVNPAPAFYGRLRQLIEPGGPADYMPRDPKARQLSTVRDPGLAANPDAAILIGGVGGTYEVFQAALERHPQVPILPLAGSGGAATRAYNELLDGARAQEYPDARALFLLSVTTETEEAANWAAEQILVVVDHLKDAEWRQLYRLVSGTLWQIAQAFDLPSSTIQSGGGAIRGRQYLTSLRTAAGADYGLSSVPFDVRDVQAAVRLLSPLLPQGDRIMAEDFLLLGSKALGDWAGAEPIAATILVALVRSGCVNTLERTVRARSAALEYAGSRRSELYDLSKIGRVVAQAQLTSSEREAIGPILALLGIHRPASVAASRPTSISPHLERVLLGHSGVILRSSWDHTGSILVTGSVDRTAIVWEVATGRQIARLLGHSQGVNQAVYSPSMGNKAPANGDFVATCSFDRTIRIWSTHDWTCVSQIQAHQDDIPDVAWSPSGALLASASVDKRVTIWDASSGLRIRSWEDHTDSVLRVVWLNESTIASSSWDGTVVIRNVSGDGEIARKLAIETTKMPFAMALCMSSDAQLLAVCAPDGRVQIWDPSSGKRVRNLGQRSSDIARSATFSPDGKYVAANTYGSNGTVMIWDIATGNLVTKFSEPTSGFWPGNIAWSPTQHMLATLGRQDLVVRIWDMGTQDASGRPRRNDSP